MRVSPSWVREWQFLYILAKVCCCQSCFILVVLWRVSFGFNLDFPDEQWCRTLFSVKATMSMACSWPKMSPFVKSRYQAVENVSVVLLCTIEKLVTCLSHNIPISAFYIVSTFLKFVWIKKPFLWILVLSFGIWIKIRQNVRNV